MSVEEEAEVAKYVLAYLLQHNYSQTAATFQGECQYLLARGNSFMILPSTALKDIIVEHKTRQSTGVLVKSLGTDLAWKALWEKLQQTLDQINDLAQGITVGGVSAKPNARPKAVGGIKMSTTTRQQSAPRGVMITPSQRGVSPVGQRGASSMGQSGVSPMGQGSVSRVQTMEAAGKSPRKNRSVPPKRKLLESSAAEPVQSVTAEVNDGLQNILDSLIANSDIHEKLASAINQYVSPAPEGGSTSTTEVGVSQSLTPSFLSDSAMDNILEMAITEPWFEELASTTPTTDPPTQPASQAPSHANNSGTCSSQTVSTAAAVAVPPNAKRHKPQQDAPITTTATSLNLDFERFLDKLHKK